MPAASGSCGWKTLKRRRGSWRETRRTASTGRGSARRRPRTPSSSPSERREGSSCFSTTSRYVSGCFCPIVAAGVGVIFTRIIFREVDILLVDPGSPKQTSCASGCTPHRVSPLPRLTPIVVCWLYFGCSLPVCLQEIRHVLGSAGGGGADGAPADDPVTSLDMFVGSDYLVAGHGSGQVFLWDYLRYSSVFEGGWAGIVC